MMMRLGESTPSTPRRGRKNAQGRAIGNGQDSIPPAPVDSATRSLNATPFAAPKPNALSWTGFATTIVGFAFICIPGAVLLGFDLLPMGSAFGIPIWLVLGPVLLVAGFLAAFVGVLRRGRKWPAVAAFITAGVGLIISVPVLYLVVLVVGFGSVG